MKTSAYPNFALTLCFLLAASVNISAMPLSSPREVEIKVFFSNTTLPAFETDCGAGEYVTRRIPATRRVADAAMKQLFAGPTDAEKAKGMEGIPLVGKYYLGVSIKKRVAIVNFRPGAEEHLLNAPLCMQDVRLSMIENTLKQFSAIKSVQYAINGKVIKEWDV